MFCRKISIFRSRVSWRKLPEHRKQPSRFCLLQFHNKQAGTQCLCQLFEYPLLRLERSRHKTTPSQILDYVHLKKSPSKNEGLKRFYSIILLKNVLGQPNAAVIRSHFFCNRGLGFFRTGFSTVGISPVRRTGAQHQQHQATDQQRNLKSHPVLKIHRHLR